MQSWFYFRWNGKAKVFAALWLGLAGVGCLNAQNIALVGQHKPPQASTGFGDVWAEGNIACMGTWTAYGSFGVGIYDIANPASPTLLTVHNFGSGLGNQFEQGVIRNKILYIASWGNGSSSGSGLHILSLTNPAVPVLLSRITKSTAGTVTNGFDAVHTMWLERNYLYEAAHVTGSLSVKVFDVSNPFLPVYLQDIVTTNTSRVHQITTGLKGTNTILYTSGWGVGSGALGQTDIWDVSHVGTQPGQWLGRIYSGYSSHSSWPTPDGNTLIVCRETTGGEVSFYDISTLPNPSPSATANPTPLAVISPERMGLESSIPHNPVIIGNLLFLSWYQNGLQIFDITDRTKPVRVGSFDTYAPTGAASFQGNWGIYPQLGLNKVLVSDINNGFFILDASAVLTGTNNYPPLLVQSPASQAVLQGGTVTLTPTVTGSALNYQWRFQGTNLPGTTGSTLVLNGAQNSQSGNYQVVAGNAFGSVTSAVAAVSILATNSLPIITAPPTAVSIYAEQPATLEVAVVGAAPLFYQWRFNGTNLAGATNSRLTIDHVRFAEVGHYAVLITNSLGSTLSSNALLTLMDSPYLNGVRFSVGWREAAVAWNTTLPTDGRVDYGPATAGGITGSSFTEPVLSTNHAVLFSGLSPATTYRFQIVSRAGGSNFISAVHEFTTASGALDPIILDNTNSAVTYIGTWNTSVNVAGYYGSNYRYANVSLSTLRTAIFTPTIPAAGKYDVYTRYSASTDRATNAPYTIAYAGGFVTNRINQQINGGQWNLLTADLFFNAGTNHYVRLANNANNANNSVVIADAVQFVPMGGQEFPTNGNAPAWWLDFHFGTTANPADDPDGDGFTTGQEYILGTSPTAGAQAFDVETFRSGSSANIIFWPMLADRRYTLQQSADLSAGWQTLATAPTLNPDSGSGVFSLPLGQTNQAFYRIAAQWQTNGGANLKVAQSLSLYGTSVRPFFGADADPSCGPNRIYVK